MEGNGLYRYVEPLKTCMLQKKVAEQDREKIDTALRRMCREAQTPRNASLDWRNLESQAHRLGTLLHSRRPSRKQTLLWWTCLVGSCTSMVYSPRDMPERSGTIRCRRWIFVVVFTHILPTPNRGAPIDIH